MNLCVRVSKVSVLGQEASCLCEGGGNCLKYLGKGSWKPLRNYNKKVINSQQQICKQVKF